MAMDHGLWRIYHDDLPGWMARAMADPALMRIDGVGMNCGCEYTSFPRFRGLQPYSRLEHSVGVGLIAWHFTGSAAQGLAGLLHDVASPCFAHVVDFMNGDHLCQESTEAGTADIIDASPGLKRLLSDLGLTVADVADYHIYPIADNDTPRLSADRLEYTLGNLVNYGFASMDDIRSIYRDLEVGKGEDGAPELTFRSDAPARLFCEGALRCSDIYVSDPDRYAMQALAELLRDAVAAGVIDRQDLWTTEPAIIARLEADPAFRARWHAFRRMNATESAGSGEGGSASEGWRVVPAKKRWIDPLVRGVRASQRFPDFAARASAFLARDLEAPVRGFVQNG